MIRVRDDDVLLSSSSYDDELGRLKQIHDWICEVPDWMIHVPAILVTEIQQFPEAIEWVRQETLEGRMLPEIHGFEHINYAELEYDTIVNQLEYCRGWIRRKFDYEPTRWYTPWGAGEDEAGAHLRPAAEAVGLTMVTCKNINMNGRYGVVQELMDGRDLSYLDNQEIFMHWWEGGARLKRIVEVAKHGSWKEAEKANRKLFRG